MARSNSSSSTTSRSSCSLVNCITQTLRASSTALAGKNLVVSGWSANVFCSAHTESTHHQSLDIVLLRDGNKFLNGATSEVFAHLDREARVEILRHHQVVQLLVTGSGCVNADD